jgi:hypothetical protein
MTPTHSTAGGREASTQTEWKAGDWAVFDLKIVQIKEIRDSGCCEVSDGMFATCGHLLGRLRPLTLRNKAITEYFDYWYGELRNINGNAGFNYPDISRHFSQLALNAIDGDPKDASNHDLATEFVREARRYTPVIQGVGLFRAALKTAGGE